LKGSREARVMGVVLILSMAGIGIATFLVANHYKFVDSKFCTINSYFSCEDVNTGEYSEMFPGMPWAVVGLAGFVAVFCLSYLKLYYPHLDGKERFVPLLLLFSVIGVSFVIYLNYLEIFVIFGVCPFCLASHTIMIVILLIIAWWYFAGRHKGEEDAEVTQTPGDSE